MNYQVSEKRGETRRISLREIGETGFEVVVDGQVLHVDAVRSGPMIYSIIENGKQFEAMVDEKGIHGFDVMLRGQLFHLEAVDERTQLLAGSAAVVASGPQTVAAEMPGKVVRVHAAAGDAVSEGQGVVVVEAMKMENEIPSPIAGVVREVVVSEGQTVEAGTTLFVVDPLPPG